MRYNGKEHIKKSYTIKCKKCGKPFIIEVSQYMFNLNKYKKYCSYSCSNSHIHSCEENNRRKNSILQFYKDHPELKNPKKRYICKNCGNEFFVNENKNDGSRKYCCSECRDTWMRINIYNKSGGYRENAGRGKQGWYNGIHCDSTYELAYLIYCIDHNKNIKRSDKKFPYILNGITRTYNPDFEIDSGLVEIKGYHTELVDIKLKSEKEPITILYKKDIQYCFDYIKIKYGKTESNIHELYDNYKPKYEYECCECHSKFWKDKLLKTNLVFCSQHCSGIYSSKHLLQK